MMIFATICMIPYTFTVIIVSFFVTIIPSKSHSIEVFIQALFLQNPLIIIGLPPIGTYVGGLELVLQLEREFNPLCLNSEV
jgi:hypothetical protein